MVLLTPTAKLAAIAPLFLTATWACAKPPVPEWQEMGTHRWRELSVPRGKVGFDRLSGSRTGIRFVNDATQEQTLRNRHLAHGAGVALGDADGDGLTDVFLGRTDGPNALYRNLGNWKFEDIAVHAGVAAAEKITTGAVFADVDGDRDLDLFLAALGSPPSVFVNDGTGVFTERVVDVGTTRPRGSTTIALADLEGDGDLDAYVTNYKFATALDLFAPDERAFDRVVQKTGDRYEVAPEFQQHYRVETRLDLNAVVRIQRAEPDDLLLNDGTGAFTRAAFTDGRFLDQQGAPLTDEPDYFGLAAKFSDVDGDGDPDLYVCNDFEDPDQFWINDGTGTFRAAPALALRTTSNSAMAIDFADIDRDGDTDFFQVDMLSRDRRRRQTQTPTHTPLPKAVGDIATRAQWQRNTLAVNRGDGTFAQVAELAGVAASDWSWATLFLDVDLDGYEDLLVTTGHVWDIMDADTQRRIRAAPSGMSWRNERLLYPSLELENVAFRNNGDLTFSEIGAAWGFAIGADISHGVAAGDLDGDGDLDVVVNRFRSPAGVFRNTTPAGRIAVRLVGAPPNTQGVGAKITVRGGPVMQTKEVAVGGLYLSSSEPLYTFATGGSEELIITVDWRTGKQSVIDARPNRLYEIRESGATHPEEALDSIATTLFIDVSERLNHQHTENQFDDFRRQPLLPYQLSRLGPGVTWYDTDADGDEDLLISAGGGGSLAHYRNDRGRFTYSALLGANAYDQTAVLPLPHPTLRSGITLLVGQSSYESRTPSDALTVPSVVALSIGGQAATAQPEVAVPGDTASVGPLASADYDNDGDLDVFVGGRVVPGAYPAPPSSRLLRNEEARLTLDRTNRAALASVGLVSAATFSDIDGDGDPDLLLALDTGPITLLVNHEGQFSRVHRRDLDQYTSRWNGIATGDVDGDGALDIVATSWGRNTAYQVSAERPLLAYVGDFDRNGTVDVVESQQSNGRLYPLASFTRLLRAMPSVLRRQQSVAAYADATLEEIFGNRLPGAPLAEITTFDHMVFLNRGASFEPRALPVEAQFAPAFHVGIADFDGDGAEDIFLSQNFYPTDADSPRHDAGRGLWLRGDGAGNLQSVPGHVSGVRVYGDQRGAAFSDYDADGRIDLVVSQNGAETKLYRNVGARPGLRVRLIGPPENPHAIGAAVRLMYGERLGPLREIRSGSGYWSHDGPVQVLGKADTMTAVWVRWPGGRETEVPIAALAGEITVRMPTTTP